MSKQKDKSNSLHPARLIAAKALGQFDEKKDFLEPILNRLMPQAQERQKVTDLAMGTLRNRDAIDLVITKCADVQIKRIASKILNIIRIAAYELLYCPQIPAYAIVNESVEACKTIAGRKQASFVNAVLRSISSHITSREAPLVQADKSKIIPQTMTSGCRFDFGILPDFEKSAAEYMAAAFSIPRWLIEEWIREFGEEKAEQICFASNRRPSIYIRPNILKTTAAELAEKLKQAKVELQVIDGSMIQLKSPKLITRLPGFASGLFTIQDISAARAVELLNPKKGWLVLDLCAAPGTKTTQIAELTSDKAKIIATDIDTARLERLKENIRRLDLKSISIIKYDQIDGIVKAAGLFDYVLLDVPCSNTGVLAKRPEVRLRITRSAIETLAKKQAELLKKAAQLLKPSGKICYSTCSIQSAENSLLIKEFLRQNKNFSIESENLAFPSADQPDCDGAYIAILKSSSKR